MRRIITIIAIALFFLNSCDLRYGFIEANFTLAPESRLPRWFAVPQGYSREDITMTITIYSTPSGGKAKLTLYGPAPEHKILMEKVGTIRSAEQKKYDVYPKYVFITVDGIEEVFEQRRRDDIFYIIDTKI